ncbi:4-hydroxyphenylpyruvate dioxygenase [Bienertia sinuspersici]
MPVVAKSDLSTGNHVHASYVLRSGDIDFLFTAPYSGATTTTTTTAAIPTFDHEAYASFMSSHGLGVRTVAIEVDDAEAAYATSMAAGARSSSPPVLLEDGHTLLAEIELFGDVVLRYISHEPDATLAQGYDFLPKFSPMHIFDHSIVEFGLKGLDHVGGALPELASVIEYVMNITGFHKFEKFEPDDLVAGLTESKFESMFLANNTESIIFNFSEPAYGTATKSPIETYLERNKGPGVQHLALITDDIFKTIREMKKRPLFEYMPSPGEDYYQHLKKSVGDVLTNEKIQECEVLGLKVDRDHEGVIIQTFTTPVGDRQTVFIEIIQRIGCMLKGENGEVYQKGGCGGFGKGNISRLFKSMEDYDKTLDTPSTLVPCLNAN